MILMHFLRALAELGFYYAFAGTIARNFGGFLALVGLLLLSGCFALSGFLREKKWARLLALAPAAGFFLLPGGGMADWIAYLPGLAYVLYLAWTEDYALSWMRQADIFFAFWVFPLFALFFTVFQGWQSLLAQGIPAFLMAASASVLLLRSIRHGPDIYLQRAYQALNWVSVILLLGFSWLASTDWFLGGVGFVYSHFVMPLLLGLAMLVGLLILLLFELFPWLIQLFLYLIFLLFGKKDKSVPQFADEPLFGDSEMRIRQIQDLLDQLLPLLGILAAAAALAFFFWWLMWRRDPDPERASGLRVSRSPHSGNPDRKRSQALPRTYAGRIRGQYRRFLRHCRKRGIEIEASDTSEEVEAKARRRLVDRGAELADLRLLYRKARYQGTATREEYARVKKLCGELQKEL